MFGEIAGDKIRDDVKRASGNGDWMRNVQDGKDLRVRFLQDPEQWLKFREHYSQETKFFPCMGKDNGCPGCNSDSEQLQKSSRRYCAKVLDTKEAKVIALKMPVDLANRVIGKADRNGGTLLTRDFTLIRSGKGLDTTYDVEQEDKTDVDLKRYAVEAEAIDVEKLLVDQYEESFGKKEPAKAAEKPNPLPYQLAKTNASDGGWGDPLAPKEDGSQVPTSTGGGEQVITEDALKAMSREDLLVMCMDNNVTVPKEARGDKDTLLSFLLSEFGVSA